MPQKYRDLECSSDACQSGRDRAGFPLAHNQTFTMMQAFAEVALAADSFLYRRSVDATPDRLRLATEILPLVIAKNVAFGHLVIS